MDDYPSKKDASGIGVSVRGSRLALGDRNHEPRSSQCCNRLGCSINSMNGGQTEKPKHLRPNVHASSSKATAGSSSKLGSSQVELRKIHKRPQTSASSKESCLASSSNGDQFEETSDSSTSEDQTITSKREEVEDESTSGNSLLVENSLTEIGKRPATNGSKVRKRVYQRSGLGNHSFPHVSSSQKMSARHSLSSRDCGEPSEPPSRGSGASSSRYGLGSLRCTSISEVLPPRFSVADTRDPSRVRKSDRNVSSIRERNITSNSAMRTSSGNASFTSSPLSLQSPRRINRPSTLRGVTSVRTRRAPADSIRLSESSSISNVVSQSDACLPTQSQLGLSNNSSTSANSALSTSMDVPAFSVNSFRISESGNEISRSRQTTRHEGSSSHGFTGLSINRDGYRRFNIEGIAEVLFALERIEQDEESTYEQLLVLETNLLLGGLTFHDQHRELRMDIDNMTYEELLALEERMGSVGTALSEEVLSKCLNRSVYLFDPEVSGTKTCEDDVKCSICQEEYVNGDEVGCLPCDHRYHALCISVWLRLKNWCPICRAPAAPE